MRKKDFYDFAHASNYLEGCVIRVGEEPVYINRLINNGAPILEYFHLGEVVSGKAKLIPLSHEDVNLVPVPLGMLAPSKETYPAGFCYRIPQRRWKIGLTRNNLGIDATNLKDHSVLLFNRSDILYSSCMGNTIKGIYPSYKKAKKISEEKKRAIAFSRRFAINNKELFYKGFKVAVGEASISPKLYDKFSHLEEALEEDTK